MGPNARLCLKMRAIEQWLACVANNARSGCRLDHQRRRLTVPDGIAELSTETASPIDSGLRIFAAALLIVSTSAWAQVASPLPLPAPKHYGSSGCTPDQSAETIIASCSELIASNAVNQESLFQVFFVRGTAYARNGEIDRAIGDFDQSLKLHPGFPGALYHRGNAFFKLGDIRRAIDDYDQAISRSENFLEAIHRRGIAYETIGDKAKAIDDFRRVLKTAPWDRTAQDELKKLGEQ